MNPRGCLVGLVLGLLCWAAIVLVWMALPSMAERLSRVVVTW